MLLENCPDDIVFPILSALDSVRSLALLRCTCRRFRELSEDALLWSQTLFHRRIRLKDRDDELLIRSLENLSITDAAHVQSKSSFDYARMIWESVVGKYYEGACKMLAFQRKKRLVAERSSFSEKRNDSEHYGAEQASSENGGLGEEPTVLGRQVHDGREWIAEAELQEAPLRKTTLLLHETSSTIKTYGYNARVADRIEDRAQIDNALGSPLRLKTRFNSLSSLCLMRKNTSSTVTNDGKELSSLGCR